MAHFINPIYNTYIRTCFIKNDFYIYNHFIEKNNGIAHKITGNAKGKGYKSKY